MKAVSAPSVLFRFAPALRPDDTPCTPRRMFSDSSLRSTPAEPITSVRSPKSVAWLSVALDSLEDKREQGADLPLSGLRRRGWGRLGGWRQSLRGILHRRGLCNNTGGQQQRLHLLLAGPVARTRGQRAGPRNRVLLRLACILLGEHDLHEDGVLVPQLRLHSAGEFVARDFPALDLWQYLQQEGLRFGVEVFQKLLGVDRLASAGWKLGRTGG